jgi:hypothetical protein
LPGLRAIEFAGDELAIPAKDRVRLRIPADCDHLFRLIATTDSD